MTKYKIENIPENRITLDFNDKRYEMYTPEFKMSLVGKIINISVDIHQIVFYGNDKMKLIVKIIQFFDDIHYATIFIPDEMKEEAKIKLKAGHRLDASVILADNIPGASYRVNDHVTLIFDLYSIDDCIVSEDLAIPMRKCLEPYCGFISTMNDYGIDYCPQCRSKLIEIKKSKDLDLI